MDLEHPPGVVGAALEASSHPGRSGRDHLRVCVLGLAMTGATPTFLATPSRGRMVGAKLCTYAVVGLGYAAACPSVVLAVAIPWLAAGAPTARNAYLHFMEVK